MKNIMNWSVNAKGRLYAQNERQREKEGPAERSLGAGEAARIREEALEKARERKAEALGLNP